jgi:hypothetical protein
MARSFGRPTNGAFVGGTYTTGTLPDGWSYKVPTNLIYSNIPGEGFLVHKGVQPDEQVWLTRDGVAKGKDDVVERALAWINTTNGVGAIEGKPQLPGQYALSQNYPNPFNPTTKINFSVPSAGHVTLIIYNILGQEIKKLVNSEMAPGTYTVSFDAHEFSSGVYIYRLSSNNVNITKKMMLIK